MDFEHIRKQIYKQGASLKLSFGKTKDDTTVRTTKFREVLDGMKLDVDPGVIDRVVAFLDPGKTGAVRVKDFSDALNIKDNEGEYNPFLLERTYFGGAAKVDPTPKEKRAFSGEEVKAAYLLKAKIASAFDLKYSKVQK
jgi:hypothetical protein